MSMRHIHNTKLYWSTLNDEANTIDAHTLSSEETTSGKLSSLQNSFLNIDNVDSHIKRSILTITK